MESTWVVHTYRTVIQAGEQEGVVSSDELMVARHRRTDRNEPNVIVK